MNIDYFDCCAFCHWFVSHRGDIGRCRYWENKMYSGGFTPEFSGCSVTVHEGDMCNKYSPNTGLIMEYKTKN